MAVENYQVSCVKFECAPFGTSTLTTSVVRGIHLSFRPDEMLPFSCKGRQFAFRNFVGSEQTLRV